jgi:serine/threonine-protein kinase
MSRCPSVTQFQELLAEQAECPAEIVAHVQQCPACQRLLEDLTKTGSHPASDVSDTAAADSPVQTSAIFESMLRRLATDTTIGPAPAPGSPAQTTERRRADAGSNRYRPLRLHARGGLGEVHLAEDAELGRRVALKRIQGEYAHDPESRRRFLVEAKVTARLEHPGVVAVHGLVEDDGQPCYAMRFIEGPTLAEAIRDFHQTDYQPGRDSGERSLALRELLGHFVAVCNTLAYAHSRGVVHRDLKPANILLGKYGETLVVDWGLAKVLGPHEPETDRAEPSRARAAPAGAEAATQPGEVKGTPEFMSPEQAGGQTDQVGPPVDVFGLGAILYAILTGRPPYQGDLYQVMVRAATVEFPPPRQVKSGVPPPLEAVCLKAMAARTADRYVGALELKAEVERWLADEPVSAYRERFAARAGRWARNHRPLVTGLAAAVVVALAALAVATLLLSHANRREHAARELAERREAEAVDNFRLARQAVDEYSLKVGDDRRLKENLPLLRKELLQSVVPFYERLVARGGDGPEMRAELARACQKLADLVHAIDGPKKAIPPSEQMVGLWEELAAAFPARPGYQAELARARLLVGRLLLETGSPAAAEKGLRAAVRLQGRLADADPDNVERQADLAAGLNALGNLCTSTNHTAEAERCYWEATRHLRRLVERHPRSDTYRVRLAQNYRNLGVLYGGARERTNEQEQACRKCLTLCRALVARHPSDETYQEELASVLGNLAILYGNTHRFREGERAYRDALDVKRALAEKHPELASYQQSLVNTLDDLGTLYSKSGRLEEAEKIHLQAVPLLKRLADRFPGVLAYAVNLGGSQGNLGTVLRKRDKDLAALAWYERSIRTLEPVVRKQARHALAREFLSIAYEGRALTLKKLGRYAEAVAALDRALDYEDGPYRTTLRAEQARNRARAGDLTGACAEAADLLTKPAALHPNDWFILGIAHTVLTAKTARDSTLLPTERARRAEEHRGRAVALFDRARRAGFFDDAEERRAFQEDPEMAPLRSRPDFQELSRKLLAMQ